MTDTPDIDELVAENEHLKFLIAELTGEAFEQLDPRLDETHITRMQRRILARLLRGKGEIVRKESLVAAAYVHTEIDYWSAGNVVAVQIHRIRAAIRDSGAPLSIGNVPSYGYRAVWDARQGAAPWACPIRHSRLFAAFRSPVQSLGAIL